MGKNYSYSSRPRLAPRSMQRITIGIVGVLLLCIYFTHHRVVAERQRTLKDTNLKIHSAQVDRGVVIPKVKGEDVSWVLEAPEWTPYVYSASLPPEAGFLPLPTLRGREAMTYLTFIIGHYESLPRVTAFVHAGATQWHNDILGAYTTSILNNLHIESVTRLGYVNLRCRAEPGCPTSVNLFEPSAEDVKSKDARAYFVDFYMELFGVSEHRVPKQLGHTCCAQFAVSRERIRARPKTDYERMRHWITDSSVNITDSHGVGWVFEMVWHVVFGMEAVHCPDFEQCRCDLFGWCGAECPEEYKPLVQAAHPWLGMKLGEKYGNANAYSGGKD